ncbi:type I-E CRISPR-associated protein Cas6/Cse3/CasE [Corynebacterium sp. MSK073]|uniref:type I-E CRISPR-associated protein Cas6/Cse3/CasE n=1 Tax=unclassified Corynebacterium TaxID=2624378 RepID=UPI00254AC773|nr:type I-E CRISPR-associated protein Cas6/Cse3/CasE [Corynebacterium sp. MSK073]MDK8814241.1 type I-E CRISPR-associated protein Cas6/Cse3/CasE [Corynebacterium sp. MSK073]
MSTLTKILINPQRRQGRKLLANPQAMHAAVAASFPPDVAHESGRILWRLDGGAHHHSLYVVGPEKPTDHVIVEQAGWDTRPGQSVEYDRLLNSLTKGQRWIFELVANPTYSQANGGKRGKVKAHVSVEHQLEWLYRRAENAGFELAPRAGDDVSDDERSRWSVEEETAIIERKTLDFRKGNGNRRVRIATARYRGTLEVKDPEALRHTLTHGIGRARGYGCGMMTLARPMGS